MKKTLIIFILAALTGCAHTTSHNAPLQQYRVKDVDQPVTITGRVLVDRHAVSKNSASALISFNGVEQIRVPLDLQGNGQAIGQPFQEKPTSATCQGTPVARKLTQVDCVVFIDNERTVTLTF